MQNQSLTLSTAHFYFISHDKDKWCYGVVVTDMV